LGEASGVETGTRTAAATVLCLFALGAAAAPAGASVKPCPDEFAAAGSITAKSFEESVTCLVNRVRASTQSGRVRGEDRLRMAAGRHTQSMVSDTFFSHRDEQGRDPADRIRATGYTKQATRWAVAENIGWGSGDQSSPYSIVYGWWLSPPHKAAMIDPRFQDIGVAVKMGAPASASAAAPSPVTVTTEFGFRRG
jgi:uncharacterized protein YkwD